ncbi:MAG TPA: enoyl-CoA hydratase-related protein [Rhizomicrobium sp.]|nr:enoyl-CoA hydratase-related protein [Rhizomicrobium sp.]
MSLVTIEIVDQVAVLKLNNPAALNAMSPDMARALHEKVEEAEKSARSILLTGEGRAFCSGAALGGGGGVGSNDGEFDAGARLESHYNPMMLKLRALSIPFVTAVHGAAAGVGCSVALAGDLIVADQTAYFLQAFRNIGLVPDGGSPYLLASAAGRVRAMEAMLLGERISAETAYNWGMINRLAPEGKDFEVGFELAKKLADGPRATLGLIRQLAWGALDKPFEEQLAAERATQKIAGRTAECREGVAAFLEKRKARFNTL